MKIIKRALFSQQLSDIFDNTAEKWGLEQAQKYVGGLQEAIELASKREKVWRRFTSLKKEPPLPVYSIFYQKHLVFFEFSEEENTMVILAVFHQAMNLPQHLKNVISITDHNFKNHLK